VILHRRINKHIGIMDTNKQCLDIFINKTKPVIRIYWSLDTVLLSFEYILIKRKREIVV